jgi:hypothetical protein
MCDHQFKAEEFVILTRLNPIVKSYCPQAENVYHTGFT